MTPNVSNHAAEESILYRVHGGQQIPSMFWDFKKKYIDERKMFEYLPKFPLAV